MDHIKEEYGQPCNHIKCSYEEYLVMKNSFREIGVAVRMVLAEGDVVICQVINPYEEFCDDERIIRESKNRLEMLERL